MEHGIQIDREILQALTEKARQAGMSVGEFTNALLRREVSGRPRPQAAQPDKRPTFSLEARNIPGGNLDKALHLSAALEDDAELISTDSDFGKLDQLKWTNPLNE